MHVTPCKNNVDGSEYDVTLRRPRLSAEIALLFPFIRFRAGRVDWNSIRLPTCFSIAKEHLLFFPPTWMKFYKINFSLNVLFERFSLTSATFPSSPVTFGPQRASAVESFLVRCLYWRGTLATVCDNSVFSNPWRTILK